ncbi:hypothetical protein HPP92_016231 [Vanilla planifolia]|uniref:Uncharacterized protein n=1 Tax=Vanilla planifolia TaxID=51239 RepID=A0A835UT56_VANPL|nr:hypothetical protein HPP92_016231 [Vanilla planifolia]
MQLSYSLQDLPTYNKVISGEFNPETDRSTSVKPFRILQREGAASSFSKEKSLASTTSVSKQCLRASICLSSFILLGLFIYGCSIYYRRSYQNGTTKYYVILDCGSTGTRVNVYQSSLVQPKDDRSLPFLLKSLPEEFQQKSSVKSGRAYQRMETEPGLHKLVRNGTGLAFAIKPLLKWAEKQIPNHAYKSTSLFLYATAGVRRLPDSDSEWLLETAWSILKNSSFVCHKEWVKIISGMEEAYYGWLALNYHRGMMGSLSTKGTFGSLDLGGSSLQVTFETEKPVYDGTA